MFLEANDSTTLTSDTKKLTGLLARVWGAEAKDFKRVLNLTMKTLNSVVLNQLLGENNNERDRNRLLEFEPKFITSTTIV
jgi:hypothetical protein